MKLYKADKSLLSSLPEEPGVYLFKDESGKPIYVGKAKNLKSRVSSYFALHLGVKTARMRSEAKLFSFIAVSSEIEALLLEAKLVRDNLPKYNAELKDDKSPLYICITKEVYPRVITLRRTQLDLFPLKNIFGPFTQATAARRVMKYLRRVVPYSHHKPGRGACVYHQIGLCNPCPSDIESQTDPLTKEILKKQYKKNLKNVRLFLSGKLKSIRRNLETEMKQYSQNQEYEAAAAVAKHIKAIELMTSAQTAPIEYVNDPSFVEDIRQTELDALKKLLAPHMEITKLSRIECFDVAHLAGTNPTASMVTFIDGTADKRYYRHFKIRRKRGDSDVDSMREVLSRRLKHLLDWGTPDLIIVDGGKPQVSVASQVIPADIAFVGLAKRYETIVIKKESGFVEVRIPTGPALNLVQRIRDEAHRFARRLHHKHVAKNLLSK